VCVCFAGLTGNMPCDTQDAVQMQAQCWHSYSVPLMGNKQSNVCPHALHSKLMKCSPDYWNWEPVLGFACSSFTACLPRLSVIHMQYIIQHASAYAFHQVDIRLQETECGSVWMNSPPGTLSFCCVVRLSILFMHPVDCTVLQKLWV
jgi:hypothetical protein